ncbi:MAG: radical SAM protein [Nanoarchaeota archaeon]
MNSIPVNIGGKCNNNCLCCKNEKTYTKNFEEIQEILKKNKEMANKIIFTGGEITIRKDFFEIIDTVKQNNYTLYIESNGRMFASKRFSQKSANIGPDKIIIYLYGQTRTQHDYITGVPGSFRQTMKGIKNLIFLRANVATNIVITKSNYRDMPNILRLCQGLGIRSHHITFKEPIGTLKDNFDSVVPRMLSLTPFLNEILRSKKNYSKIYFHNIPFCVFKPNGNSLANKMAQDIEIDENTILQENSQEKIKLPECTKCKYFNACAGIWKEYVNKVGNKEFEPVK